MYSFWLLVIFIWVLSPSDYNLLERKTNYKAPARCQALFSKILTTTILSQYYYSHFIVIGTKSEKLYSLTKFTNLRCEKARSQTEICLIPHDTASQNEKEKKQNHYKATQYIAHFQSVLILSL